MKFLKNLFKSLLIWKSKPKQKEPELTPQQKIAELMDSKDVDMSMGIPEYFTDNVVKRDAEFYDEDYERRFDSGDETDFISKTRKGVLVKSITNREKAEDYVNKNAYARKAEEEAANRRQASPTKQYVSARRMMSENAMSSKNIPLKDPSFGSSFNSHAPYEEKPDAK